MCTPVESALLHGSIPWPPVYPDRRPWTRETERLINAVRLKELARLLPSGIAAESILADAEAYFDDMIPRCGNELRKLRKRFHGIDEILVLIIHRPPPPPPCIVCGEFIEFLQDLVTLQPVLPPGELKNATDRILRGALGGLKEG